MTLNVLKIKLCKNEIICYIKSAQNNIFRESQVFKKYIKEKTQMTSQQNSIMRCEYENIEQIIVSTNHIGSHDIVLYKKCKNARLM